MSKIENLNGEIWLSVVGYEGLYEISNYGRLMCLEKTVPHPHSKTKTYPRKIKATVDNGKGYRQTQLSTNGKHITVKIHRLVCDAFLGVSDLDINHKNCIRHDNRLENLEYVTTRQNEHRKIVNRKYPVGVSLNNKKFTAKISINGKTHRLGQHETPELAGAAYQAKLSEIKNEQTSFRSKWKNKK
jgi:hypothetical protein